MNCLIVDDDESSVIVLKQLAAQSALISSISSCNNALTAIDLMKKEKFDLLFLDIEMPEMTGIELIRFLEARPMIILTTSHTEYALEAFEYNVVDYLTKPLSMPRFMKAVEKARILFVSTNNQITYSGKEYIFIKCNSVISKVPVKDIQWIEALGDYITINTIDKKFTIHLTLKALAAKLPPDRFIRVHRSYMVALDNITAVEDSCIYIKNQPIPIGALYRDAFYKSLNLL